jgi:hypothetical protein
MRPIGNCKTRGSAEALSDMEAGSGVIGYTATPKPIPAGKRGRSLGTHGGAGVHLSREVRSGATGHMAAQELTSTRRLCPVLSGTWQRRSPPR